MPTFTRKLTATTDGNGEFSRAEVLNPPIPDFIDLTVELAVTLLRPADATVELTLDIDEVGGGTTNDPKAATLVSGQTTSLGSWVISGGDNAVVVSGRTVPARPNTSVEIEAEISF